VDEDVSYRARDGERLRLRSHSARRGGAVKTSTYFAFRVDAGDGVGDNIIEHVAGIDDWPSQPIAGPSNDSQRRRSRCAREHGV